MCSCAHCALCAAEDFAATTNSAYFYAEGNIGGVNDFGAITPPQMTSQPPSAYTHTGAELEGMHGASASGSQTGPGASTVNGASFTTRSSANADVMKFRRA